jgi:hypothetical protein
MKDDEVFHLFFKCKKMKKKNARQLKFTATQSLMMDDTD